MCGQYLRCTCELDEALPERLLEALDDVPADETGGAGQDDAAAPEGGDPGARPAQSRGHAPPPEPVVSSSILRI